MAALRPLRRAGAAILESFNPARRSHHPDLSSVLPAGEHAGRRATVPRGPRRRSGASQGPPPPAARAAGRERSLTLHAWEGDVLGAALGMTDTGAVILNIREGGLLDGWNEANPKERVYPGLVITGVNGARGYWAIVESLKRPGVLTLTVSDQPPPTAGPKWFEDIAAMGRSVVPQEVSGDKSSFIIRLQQDGPSADSLFSSLPNVVAGDGGVDQCSICLDDIGPDEVLVELPCKHAFHPACAARWLTQGGAHARGKRQCCPLCCRRVLAPAPVPPPCGRSGAAGGEGR